jgi:tRNA(Glu) U13 pseudouridine synthase TruD
MKRQKKNFELMYLHRVLPMKFKNLNQRIPAIKVGNFQICETPLRLGQLQGNRFELFIR